MQARELSGNDIGKKIEYYRGGRLYITDEVTMITHKKNGGVLVRYGKNNAQATFRPLDLVEIVSLTPPKYYATLAP